MRYKFFFKIMVILLTVFLLVSCDNSPKFSKVSEISSGELKAEVFTSAPKIQIHETINLQIRVTFPFDSKLQSFDLTEKNDEIILNDSHLSLPGVISKNLQTQQINCSFYANSFGPQKIPAIKINFSNGKNLLTKPVMFEVLAPKQVPQAIHGIDKQFSKSSMAVWLTLIILAVSTLTFYISLRKKNLENSEKIGRLSLILASKQPPHEKVVAVYNFLQKEGKHPNLQQKMEAKIFAKTSEYSLEELLKEAGELS